MHAFIWGGNVLYVNMMIKTNEPQDKALDCAVSIQEYFGFVGFAITVKPFLYLCFYNIQQL